MSELIHVAAAAIVNKNNEVLISRRADDMHQGGLWEFPGGKLEIGETVEQALVRELAEELDIQAKSFRPLIKVEHHYADKSVLLDVWKVDDYSGSPSGKEGQPIKWQATDQLDAKEFPAADVPIIQAINLPEHYLITGKFDSAEVFERHLVNAINNGIKLVQLRLTNGWLQKAGKNLAKDVIEIATSLSEQSNVELMFNTPDGLSGLTALNNIHLNSQKLASLNERPECNLLSASCHTVQEMKKSVELGANFIVLSPVQSTNSHPDAVPLGWQQFSEMIASVNIPVYALGGVTRDDTEQAWISGGQGISAISALWDID